MTPVRTRVVLDAMEVTAPIPRQPRRPVTPFAPRDDYQGRHRMPGWVARIGSGAIPVHHLTTVERSDRGMAVIALLLAAITVALGVWLAFGIAYTSPAMSLPEPVVEVSSDSPKSWIVPTGVR